MPVRFLLVSVLFFYPFVSSASAIISEIMYDVEGADGGREWIEVFNNGNDAVDLSGWRLYEADVNHKINLVKETDSFVLPAQNYAVVADDSVKFAVDWPNFPGKIFSSSFSLSNTGENLILRNPELTDIDNVSYNSGQGANGNGDSLQKINGNWIAEKPTPGTANSGSAQSRQPEQAQNFSVPRAPAGTSGFGLGSAAYVPPEKQPHIKADAGQDRATLVGVLTEFRGKAYGLTNEPLNGARFLWNFGDGVSKDGQNIEHSYSYPGKYIVFLDVVSGEYSASDIFIIDVLSNGIYISEIKSGQDSFVELTNNLEKEIDISRWQIRAGGKIFSLPKNTFISAKSSLVFAGSVTGISLPNNQDKVELLYPGNFLADTFNYGGVLAASQSFSKIDEKIVVAEETPGKINSPLSPSKIINFARSDLESARFGESEKNKTAVVSPQVKNVPSSSNNAPSQPKDVGEKISGDSNVFAAGNIQEAEVSGAGSFFARGWVKYLSAVFGIGLISGAGLFFIRRKRQV